MRRDNDDDDDTRAAGDKVVFIDADVGVEGSGGRSPARLNAPRRSYRQLVLNRPSALNALDGDVIHALLHVLTGIAHDRDNRNHSSGSGSGADAAAPIGSSWSSCSPAPPPLVISGAKHARRDGATSKAVRAFCAGGDVKALSLHLSAVLQRGARRREHVVDGDDDREAVDSEVEREALARDFLTREYRVLRMIRALVLGDGAGDGWRARRVAEMAPATSVICVGDGLVMGAGLGIFMASALPPAVAARRRSARSCRIVTERSVLAMPECMIGIVPDVGASYWLCRVVRHGAVGLFMALTGARVNAREAMALGLATHFIPVDRLERLFSGGGGGVRDNNDNNNNKGEDAVDEDVMDMVRAVDHAAVDVHAHDAPAMRSSGCGVLEHLALVDRCFGGKSSVTEVIEALQHAARSSAFAERALGAMRAASPFALEATFAVMRQGYADCALVTGARSSTGGSAAGANNNNNDDDDDDDDDAGDAATATRDDTRAFHRALDRELAANAALCARADFIEGVAAQLIRKERQPQWQPSRLCDVDRRRVYDCIFGEKRS